MANKIKPRLIIVLTVIMIVSSLVLTFVYQITKPVIKAHSEAKQEAAILDVLPTEATEYERITKEYTKPVQDNKKAKEKELTLYKGLDSSGNVVGYAVENSGQGFQSKLKLMIGLDLEQSKIIKINILSQAETPGLGARITEPDFKSQFKGKSFADSFTAKEDVDAITGATISSQALSDVLATAIDDVQQAYSGGE
ncbi:RnfABCDGE type electron transport complex subunit G [Halanaerobaculum tunisiense]